jgi:hypothetical protein
MEIWRFKMINLILILLVLFPSLSINAQKEAESRHYAVNLSVWYPLSLNKTKLDSTNLNLSLFYGRVGHVRGLDLGGIVSVVEKDLTGVEVCGLSGIVKNNTNGGQISGLFNMAGKDFKGMQLSGLMNFTGDNGTGVQISGLLNMVGNNMRGLQLGLVNVAGHMRGVQVGIVNVAKKQSGLPIGLVNLGQDGNCSWISWASNLVGVQSGLKIQLGSIYTILSLGSFNLYKDIEPSLAYGFHYGLHVPLKRCYLNIDMGVTKIDNKSLFYSSKGEIDQTMLDVRGILGFRISRQFALFLGAGLARIYDHKTSYSEGEYQFTFLAGVELFQFNFLKHKVTRK